MIPRKFCRPQIMPPPPPWGLFYLKKGWKPSGGDIVPDLRLATATTFQNIRCFLRPMVRLATMIKPNCLILVSFLSQVFLTSCLSSKREAPKLSFIRPRSGDNFVVSDSDFRFLITWVNTSSEFNASIAVRQGPPDNLSLIELITGILSTACCQFFGTMKKR